MYYPTAVDCGSLSFPTNGILRFSSTTIGGVARYSCSDLYRLLGSSTRTCMINGQWSGTEPTCVCKFKTRKDDR